MDKEPQLRMPQWVAVASHIDKILHIDPASSQCEPQPIEIPINVNDNNDNETRARAGANTIP